MGLVAAGIAALAVAGVVLLLWSRRWSEMAPSSEARGATNPGAPKIIPGLGLSPGTATLTFQIDNVLVKRAAGKALDAGGDLARHFVRKGDAVAVDLASIADPDDRRRAAAILAALARGGDTPTIGAPDVLWLAALLTRKSP